MVCSSGDKVLELVVALSGVVVCLRATFDKFQRIILHQPSTLQTEHQSTGLIALSIFTLRHLQPTTFQHHNFLEDPPGVPFNHDSPLP